MIHIREEGTPTRQGLNLYPWSDRHTAEAACCEWATGLYAYAGA
jgi:hypothetical protein